nr:hypothetical protein [Tanacetum cinerariifolium]
MTSFGYRLNPRFAIKECSSCGALYTRDCSYLKGSVEDKILVPKPPKNCARCAKCGHPVNGLYCQGCALLREKLEEDLISYLKYFHDTSESSDDGTTLSMLLESHSLSKRTTMCARCGHPVDGPYCQGCALLRKKLEEDLDQGVNPPHIDECCCECGAALNGILCQQCTCKSCGKGAHIGYNCLPKVSIIFNPEPCNQTINNELPQTLPSFDPTCYSDKENSVPCVLKPNFVDESSNIFNPPPQPPIYSCEFCRSNAQYGHYCIPQVPFINPEPSYIQDFNFPQDIHDFQQQYLCCDQCGGPHETFQCQQKQKEKWIEEEQAANARYWKISTCCDDDDDYNSAITPVLSTEEPDNSLSMGDEHLDTILATESDKVIKSSVKDLNDQFPPTDRSDFTHEEFVDELAHIIYPPEYDCFYFRNLPDPGELISILNSEIRENLSTTRVNLPVEDDHFPLLAYVVWIFLAYLTYPVIPPYLHSFGNEDTIFDPGIAINHFYSFKPGLSHRHGTFKKYNTHRSHLNESPMEMLFSTCFLMDQ